ncbi:MAG TPA: hypothetical protein VMA75_02070 [Candidatus Paceibacterota bacterium]|nr:hypothetical protein [Candidatus Paceibacterota bacterium]
MEPSEKEKLLEEVRLIVREEVSPALNIIMTYLDTQFDIVEERSDRLFEGVAEALTKIVELLER